MTEESIHSLPIGDLNAAFIQVEGYEVLGIIGQGGMGAVYRAQQDSPRREVALKVVKSGLTHAEAFRRFQLESQVLGQLEHPGIARIYAAGTSETADGPQPWFAMELVRGLPVLEYAEKHGLDRRQRLLLMAKICDAVHYAHRKGVVHRDLKPANILVTESETQEEVDEDSSRGTTTSIRVRPVGQPKILDFGVARVTNSDLQATTMQTDIGQLVGTIPYMSPEQVRGIPDDIDARSDVYALGVLMHELLTGHRPYDLKGKSIPEALRIIEQDEPDPMSSHDRTFRGDIDTIVQKALEKEKERRYATAEDLASDIRRHLRDEPILARPPSTVYQLKKFARRNKALVGGVAVAFLLMIAGTTVSLVLAARATLNAKKFEEIARITGDMLNSVTPQMAEALDTKLMRLVLDGTELRMEEGEPSPEIEHEVRYLLATSYQRLKETEALRRQIERLRALEDDAAPTEERRLQTDRLAGLALLDEGDYAAAEEAFDALLAEARAFYGPTAPETFRVLASLTASQISVGRTGIAVEALEEQLPICVDALGDDHEATISLRTSLIVGYQRQRDFPQALEVAEKVYETRGAKLDADHPDAIQDLATLASAYDIAGDPAKAEEQYLLAVERSKRVYGADNPFTLKLLNNYASSLTMGKKHEEGLAVFQQVLEDRRRVLGPEHVLTLYSMRNVARTKQMLGHTEEAKRDFGEVLELRRRCLGEAHRDTAQSYTDLALLYHRAGDMAQAAKYFGYTAESFLKVAGEEDPVLAFYFYRWAAVLQDSGDQEQAEEVYRRCLDIHADYDGKDRDFLGAAINGLAKACAVNGKSDEAEERFREAIVVRDRVHGEGSVDAAYSYSEFAEFLIGEDRADEAEPWARKAISAREEHLGPKNGSTQAARSILARSLVPQGRYDEAEELFLGIWRVFEGSLPTGHPRRAYVLGTLSDLYAASGNETKQAEIQALLDAEQTEPVEQGF